MDLIEGWSGVFTEGGIPFAAITGTAHGGAWLPVGSTGQVWFVRKIPLREDNTPDPWLIRPELKYTMMEHVLTQTFTSAGDAPYVLEDSWTPRTFTIPKNHDVSDESFTGGVEINVSHLQGGLLSWTQTEKSLVLAGRSTWIDLFLRTTIGAYLVASTALNGYGRFNGRLACGGRCSTHSTSIPIQFHEE